MSKKSDTVEALREQVARLTERLAAAGESPPAWTVSPDVFPVTPHSGYIITQAATGRQWLIVYGHAMVEVTQQMEKK